MPKKVPAKKPLTTVLKAANKKRRCDPVWKGPEEDGITQSLLSRFLVCRERFRLLVVEGLKPDIGFNSRMEYGHMFHLCCEEAAMGNDWQAALKSYAVRLAQQYRQQSAEVDKWYRVCKIQFPQYWDWLQSMDLPNKTPLLREYSFKYVIKLPSGRNVRLLGKMDGVDVTTVNRKKMLILDENKTKGDIDDMKITRQLSFDLQTMLYLSVMKMMAVDPTNKDIPDYGVYGVSYNLIKRPLSGGVGTIRQRKPTKNNPGETKEEYYERLSEVLHENRDTYYMVKDVTVSPHEIERFNTMFLIPALEALWDWWEWVRVEPDNPFRAGNQFHFMFPYGVFNPMLEGNFSDVDNYLLEGSKTGLTKVESLFQEL